MAWPKVSRFKPAPSRLNLSCEMRRVFRPTGISIIAARTPEFAAAAPFAREEFGFRTNDRDEVGALHREAGVGCR